MFSSRKVLNHYQTLGVGFRASAVDIKLAYHDLAKKFHPDQNAGDSVAEQKFRKVKDAYETLSDRVRRSAYDKDCIASGNTSFKVRVGGSESDSASVEDDQGLSRSQFVFLYAVVLGLPLFVSIFRRDPAVARSSPARVEWSQTVVVPEASPRDELVRAFFNPMTRRWERLNDTEFPPLPLDLFQFTVKQHRGTYNQSVHRGVSMPTRDSAPFEVHSVPLRLTQNPALVHHSGSNRS